jgi:hypothetical protein
MESPAVNWSHINNAPTCWQTHGQVYHESLLRASRIVGAVREMLIRRDSAETILGVIDMLSEGMPGGVYDCDAESTGGIK